MAVEPDSGVVLWTPNPEQVGTNPGALLRVSDGQGGVDIQYFELSVTAPNNAPVFTSTLDDNLSPQIGKPFQYQAVALDPDNDPVTYQLGSGNPAGVTMDADTGLLTWTPQSNQLGAREITIEAVDDKGATATQALNLNVITPQPNRPPEFTSTPRKNVRIGSHYFYQATATDPDGNPLSFNLITAPHGLTIDGEGRVIWSPNAAQFGSHSVEIQVTDGQGGEARQSFTLVATDRDSNNLPSITSTPNTRTHIDKLYTYQPTATDPDGDLLLWSLEHGPRGMVLDPHTGAISWQPDSQQIGSHTVGVKVVDTLGASVSQEFTLTVTGINTPPAIVSTPRTRGTVNTLYSYQVAANDPENDVLRYSLGLHPRGLTISEETGLISWTPTEVGNYEISVIVSDPLGASNRQTYNLEVGTEAINQAPEITSTPGVIGDSNSPYSYQVIAHDPEGDTLHYQLIAAPSGMTMDGVTGEVIWPAPVLGSHQIVVGVNDGVNGAAQGYTLRIQNNSAPVIDSSIAPNPTATVGDLYSYDVPAYDPDGDALSYSLDETSLNKGISLDNLGRLRWNPEITDVGNHVVTVTVTDEPGATTSESFQINVVGDTEAPQVDLQPVGTIYVVDSQFQTDLNSTVSFQAWATDNVGVTGLQLLVNNTPVILDRNGIASIEFKELGTIELKARAYDAVGNVGEAVTTVDVYDFSDVDAPTVELDLGDVADNTVTGPIKIKGTIDDSNLDYYVLEVAPVGSDSYREIRRGNEPVTEDVIASFDPSTLANDAYNLRLTAVDQGNNQATVEETIYVEGDLKLGNFQLSFTDLTIPVAGIPVTVTRTYDSLIANQQDDFGFGWRLEFRDTNLRTSLGKDENLEAFDITSKGFREGDRVYLTLPGGERETYIFKPQLTPAGALLQALGSASGLGATGQDFGLYEPAFVSQSDSNNQLSVEAATLIRSETGEFTGIAGGLYNPAANYYGGRYTLTTDSGIVYDIDADTGDLLTARDTNGNELNFSDAGITSDSGVEVRFGRDAQGRITRVIDPEGNEIGYEYDGNGDLVGVTDREGNRTGFGYSEVRAHYLDEIIDPLGRSGVRTEYDENGRLSRVLDVNGEAVELVYDLDNSTQTVRDVFGNPTTYVYDERGNVLTEVDALGGVIERTYDDSNNLLSETVIGDESGPDGYTTSYTYDSRNNLLTWTDPLGAVYRNTYNEFGYILSETDALGNTTSYSYDGRGNLLSTRDAAGNITSYSYDGNGNPVSLVDAAGNTTSFSYDRNGNVVEIVDALGNATVNSYDKNGNRISSTQTVTTANGIEEIVTQWEYDSNGNLLSSTNPLEHVTSYEYNDFGQRTAIIDALGRRTEYRYNEKGELVETIYPDNTPSTNSDNPRTINLYDRAGQRRATIDQLEQITHYSYDEIGRLTETIYSTDSDDLSELIKTIAPEQTLESMDWVNLVYPDELPPNLENNPRELVEYDGIGRVRANIDERGNRTEYRYNALGQIIETIYPDNTPNDLSDNSRTFQEYDRTGRTLSRTDELGRVTKYFYDRLGRLQETQYPDGTSTATTFDVNGLAIGERDRNEQITQYSYDELGRLIETIYPDETPSNNSDNPRTRSEYDELSRLIATIDQRGNRTEYSYDSAGRQILIRDALDNEISYSYDAVGNRLTATNALNRTTEFIYDELSRLIETRFSDGSYTTTTYDNLDRVIAQTDQNQNTTQFSYDRHGRLVAVVDALENRTEYGHDATGNLISVGDANNNVTTYEYDERNRRTAVVLPLGQRSETTYDAVGNILSVTDFNQDITNYTYNENNRLVREDFSDGTSLSYTYTAIGQIETVTHSGGTTTYSYDSQNRLIARTDPAGPHLATGATIEYGYDAAGNRISVTTPADTVTYTYDELNRLQTAMGSEGEITTYFYDPVGNLIRTEFPNKVQSRREYDQLNRLEYLENVRIDPISEEETIISSYSYTLDSVGNRLQVEEQDGGRVEYSYDDVYRLIEERITDSIELNRIISYTYDNTGNRLRKEDSLEGETIYFYDDNDRLISETKNGHVTTYSYDHNGNTLGIVNGNEETVYIWDKQNRLVEVVKNSGGAISYTYDHDNIRVSSTVNGVTTNYLLDKNRPYAQVLSEYVDGENTVSYVYGLDLISQERESEQSFYLVDGLGSTRVLTDGNGEITNSYTYDAFGELIESVGDGENDYLFAGEQYDENLDKYYLRQRYYDAGSGRFSRRDTYEGRIFEPITLHKYIYTHDNPINFVDPSGEFSVQGLLAIAAINASILSIGLTIEAAIGFYQLPTPGGGGVIPKNRRENTWRKIYPTVYSEEFSSADAAAEFILREINDWSIRRNYEIGGAIVKKKGSYYVTRPFTDFTNNSLSIPKAPWGYTLVADYHTHAAPNSKYANNCFSPKDQRTNYDAQIAGYLGTPSRDFKKYLPPKRGATVDIVTSTGNDVQVPVQELNGLTFDIAWNSWDANCNIANRQWRNVRNNQKNPLLYYKKRLIPEP